MKFRFSLLITASAAFCLSLAAIAPADSCVKTLYIDGNEVGQATDSNNGLAFGYTRLTIGAEGNRWYLYNEYVGSMDEFAVYEGVLDSTRVVAHYDALATSYAAYKSAVQADSPLLWLQFEDADVSNNAPATNSGSASGGVVPRYIATADTEVLSRETGIAADSNALVFPGSDESGSPGACVDVYDNGELGEDLNGDVSIELWVKFTAMNSGLNNDYPRFFQHNGDWQNEESYGIVVNDPCEMTVLGGSDGHVIVLADDINDGSWHHVVITYDSTYDPEPLPDTNSYEEEVGYDNPVLWLRFEDKIPLDSSGNGNWVGYGSAASIVEKVGGIGNSAYLDGTGGADIYGIAAAKGPNAPQANGGYEFGDEYAFAPNDITFEIWIKTLPIGEEPQPHQYAFLFQQTDWNENIAPGIGNSDGQLRVLNANNYWYTGRGAPFDGEWHQVVLVYDEDADANTLDITLYIDGYEEASNSYADSNMLGPELSHIIVGAQGDISNTANEFAGYVDEFAIYAGVLDPNRILKHYAAWQPQSCAELWERGVGIAADVGKDCDVDFLDFASFALEWMLCNDPCDAGCIPNW